MNVRLFNDNGCETPTPKGEEWIDLVRNYLTPIIEKAVKDGIALRDVQTIVNEEVSFACAHARLRRGMKEHKLQQSLHKNECGCAGVCLPTDGNPQFE